MRFCYEISNFYVDIGYPLALLLSVLFAVFMGCIHGCFSLLFTVKCCFLVFFSCCRSCCVLLFSYNILLKCVFLLLGLDVFVPSITLSVSLRTIKVLGCMVDIRNLSMEYMHKRDNVHKFTSVCFCSQP
jgi:hypothetical protein